MREARSDLAVTQDGMAEMLGVSKRTWQDYETGISVPKVSVYERLTELGFCSRWLVEGAGPKRRDDSVAPHQEDAPPPGFDAPPTAEMSGPAGEDDFDELEELMRALSFPAEIRVYGKGPLTVQLVMTAAMQYAKERDWAPDQLARLARFSRIFEEILEPTHDQSRTPASGRRDARTG